MERDSHSDDDIKSILSLHSVAVVGMSGHSSKAAHFVPKYLADNDFDITPVNPNSANILGKTSYKTITDVEKQIDIVNIFRPSDQVLPIIRAAIEKRPKVIWLQEGIHDPEAEKLAKDAGIDVVFNRCMLAEHQRLL